MGSIQLPAHVSSEAGARRVARHSNHNIARKCYYWSPLAKLCALIGGQGQCIRGYKRVLFVKKRTHLNTTLIIYILFCSALTLPLRRQYVYSETACATTGPFQGHLYTYPLLTTLPYQFKLIKSLSIIRMLE